MDPIGGLKSHAEQGGVVAFGKLGHVDLDSNLASGMKLFGSPTMIAKSMTAGSNDWTIDAIRLDTTMSTSARWLSKAIDLSLLSCSRCRGMSMGVTSFLGAIKAIALRRRWLPEAATDRE